MKTEGTNLLLLTISAFWSSSRWPLASEPMTYGLWQIYSKIIGALPYHMCALFYICKENIVLIYLRNRNKCKQYPKWEFMLIMVQMESRYDNLQTSSMDTISR